MADFKPHLPFNTMAEHLPKIIEKVNGINNVTYPDSGNQFCCSAIAWIGARKTINDVSTEEDTITIETWFNPEIKKDDRIKLLDDNSIWRVETKPEIIGRWTQYMKFKAVSVGG